MAKRNSDSEQSQPPDIEETEGSTSFNYVDKFEVGGTGLLFDRGASPRTAFSTRIISS